MPCCRVETHTQIGWLCTHHHNTLAKEIEEENISVFFSRCLSILFTHTHSHWHMISLDKESTASRMTQYFSLLFCVLSNTRFSFRFYFNFNFFYFQLDLPMCRLANMWNTSERESSWSVYFNDLRFANFSPNKMNSIYKQLRKRYETIDVEMCASS